MTTGSVLATLGVLAWSQADNVIAFYGSWLLLGIAMGLVLYEPAQVVLIKQFGARATTGDHHPHPGRRVRLDDLPTDDRRPAGRHRLARAHSSSLAIGLGVVTITLHALVLPGRPARTPLHRGRLTPTGADDDRQRRWCGTRRCSA